MSGADSQYEYVKDQARFAELCALWGELPAIGVDTEFVRTRTFYPKAGLLQFGVDSDCFLVDPLSLADWTPFRRLLDSTTVIIHAAGEDLRLLYHLLAAEPAKLFDTQLAAAFLGVGFSLSYRDLAARFCDVELPKSETRSDWLRRPLSASQLRYAANDVRYLPALHKQLEARLRARNVYAWFEEDCRRMLGVARREEDPQSWLNQYLQVNHHQALSDRGLSLLRELCYWREAQIRARNLPRNWLVEDRDLLALASHLQRRDEITPRLIRAATGVSPKFAGRYADVLSKELPRAPERPPPRRNERFAAAAAAQRDTLRECQRLVKAEAERIGMSPELLCAKKQLRKLVQSHAATGRIHWPNALDGWRRTLLAPLLDALLPAGAGNGPGNVL